MYIRNIRMYPDQLYMNRSWCFSLPLYYFQFDQLKLDIIFLD